VNRRFEPLSKAMASAVSTLHRACFPEDPWNLAAIVEIMNITGFALALYLGQECEIISLGVLPRRWREGIGSALLDLICSEGCVRGAERIVLEVAVDNSAALSLYTGRGFVPVGHRRNYYRQTSHCGDALVLQRTFTDVTIQP
jgi:ribosomal-protein-alanine N-acetyltransferase